MLLLTLAGKDPQATLDQSSNPDFDADGWNGWHGPFQLLFCTRITT